MNVTMRDVRAAKMCGRGARVFAQRHDIDWLEFVKNGIDEAELLRTNDAMAIKLVEVARERRRK